MAKRLLNRRELRKASDQAEQKKKPDEKDGTATAVPVKKTRAKSTTPKVKKPRKKKEPPRMCARWGVFDAGMKQVAIFNYNQRSEAEKKVADLAAKKSTTFFLQIVKEPMPEPEPAEAAPA